MTDEEMEAEVRKAVIAGAPELLARRIVECFRSHTRGGPSLFERQMDGLRRMREAAGRGDDEEFRRIDRELDASLLVSEARMEALQEELGDILRKREES